MIPLELKNNEISQENKIVDLPTHLKISASAVQNKKKSMFFKNNKTNETEKNIYLIENSSQNNESNFADILEMGQNLIPKIQLYEDLDSKNMTLSSIAPASIYSAPSIHEKGNINFI